MMMLKVEIGNWKYTQHYNGGGGFSFGGGDKKSVFMSAWAVTKTSSGIFKYLFNENEILYSAKLFSDAVEKFVKANTPSGVDVKFLDMDIEEDYNQLKGIGNLPGLLSTVEGQRFYGHALHQLSLMCFKNRWKLNVDIQEPFLSLPFRGLDYKSKCGIQNNLKGYTSCAPWMIKSWDANNFSTVFRHYFGVTPKGFRKSKEIDRNAKLCVA